MVVSRPSVFGAALGVLGLCGLMATPVAQAQIKELNGTWRLDHEKSQGPMSASEILIINVSDDEEHYLIHEVTKDGNKHDGEYRAKFDGKEYENKNLSSGKVNYLTLTAVFPRVEEVTNIRHMPGASGAPDSKITSRYVRALSPDGKTLYDTLINAEGKVTAFRVFDKISSKTSGP